MYHDPCFNNFDPEWNYDTPPATSMAGRDSVWTEYFCVLVHNLLASCGIWDPNGPVAIRRLRTKLEFAELQAEIEGLARQAYESRDNIWWILDADRLSVRFEDHTLASWAGEQLRVDGETTVSAQEISGFQGLLNIDYALSIFHERGWCGEFLDRVLEAAFHESESREHYNTESPEEDRLQTDEASVRSSKASALAKVRWNKDRKKRDGAKSLINECFQNWKANPDTYATQTDFARDMEEKIDCDDDGKPLYSAATIQVKIIKEIRLKK